MTEIFVTVMCAVGLLIGIWRLVESMFSDVLSELREIHKRIDNLYKLIVDDKIPPSS